MFLAKFRVNRLILSVMLSVVFSCSGNNQYDSEGYGFDQNSKPVVSANPNAIRTSSPNYYGQQQYYAPYPQQQYYQPVPVYVQPYPQQYAPVGGSRYYSNPYAIPPAAGYPQRYYDADQYYVPPSNYYDSGSDQQLKSTGYANN